MKSQGINFHKGKKEIIPENERIILPGTLDIDRDVFKKTADEKRRLKEAKMNNGTTKRRVRNRLPPSERKRLWEERQQKEIQ